MSVHYVSFSAEVTPQSAENLIAVVSQLHNQGATEIHLMLSTNGGSIMHGFNIYNVLRALPLKLVIYNVGNVDSIGNVIFLAGQERYSCSCSTFMFHGAAAGVQPGSRMDLQAASDAVAVLTLDNGRMAKVLEDRAGMKRGDALKLYRQSSRNGADWALKNGIIHAIREPKVPVGVPVHSLVFNR